MYAFVLFFSIASLAYGEYSHCICSECHVESTVGRIVNSTCYFVPVNYLSSIADSNFKHLKQYPLLRSSNINSLSALET